LKTVVSINGEYSTRNYTVFDLQNLKGKKQLSKTLPFTSEEALAAEAAGIDALNVRYNPERPELAVSIRQAAPKTFMTFAMPMQAATTTSEALSVCFDAMECGADSIMCGTWSLDFIEAAAKAGIPVEGHIGLVPRKSTWTGGLKAVGKKKDQIVNLYSQIRSLENAGAWAVEVEVVPHNITDILARNTKLVVTSIGSGKADFQFLFAQDILGDGNHFPRHSKQYADFKKIRDELQTQRVAAFKHYISDVNSGLFPTEKNLVHAANEVQEFMEKLTGGEDG